MKELYLGTLWFFGVIWAVILTAWLCIKMF